MTAALLLGLALAAPVPADKPPADDPATRPIAGTYSGSGTDIGGAKYDTTVEIAAEGDAFRVTWTTGGQQFVGVGVRNGRLLSVGWGGQAGRGVMLGVMVYEVRKDGSLDGTWTMLGAKGKVRTETLAPVRE